LQGAIEQFQAAIKLAPGTAASTDARKNMAITLNRLGTRAFEKSDFRSAENFWMQALDVDPDNSDVHYNLGKLYDRIGDRERAAREWQISANAGRISDSNPAAPGSPTAMQARYERAKLFYNEGVRLFEGGDRTGARKSWQLAIREAPGTDAAILAQKQLAETASGPDF
jgi:tetratricopeptide (TPR) repeat protein